jgi:hypothetical protein
MYLKEYFVFFFSFNNLEKRINHREGIILVYPFSIILVVKTKIIKESFCYKQSE